MQLHVLSEPDAHRTADLKVGFLPLHHAEAVVGGA